MGNTQVLHTSVKSGVKGTSSLYKTTLRLDDLLEGHTGLRGCYTRGLVYYSERIQIRISKGKRCMGFNPGETRCKIPRGPFLEELHGDIFIYSPSNDVGQYM